MESVEESLLDSIFGINISSDKMQAELMLKRKVGEDTPFTFDDLLAFIHEHGIIFGLHEDRIKSVADRPNDITYPVIISEGTEAVNGKDGYLKNECAEESVHHEENGNEAVNLREVTRIPSVTKGQKVAVIIPPEKGLSGCNIFGETIPEKDGKPFRLRPGKNIQVDESGVVTAQVEGQVNFSRNSVSVLPVYEVNGDLDLKTGNIHFVGNVVIRGNVPTGYEVKAGGDIRITGLVEGAMIEAGGSVTIAGGVTAMNRGYVKAGGDATISYINQGIIEAEGNIIVRNSVMHSRCRAGDDVVVKGGSIVGGLVSAGRRVIARDIGNHMQTQTNIFVGIDQHILERERELRSEEKATKDNILKLKSIGEKLSLLNKSQAGLDPKNKILLLKQKNSLQQAAQKYKQIVEELEELQSHFQDEDGAALHASGSIYENVDIHFGKYRRKIRSVHKAVSISLVDREITISPLQRS